MIGFVKLQGSEEHLGDDLEPASNPRLRTTGSGTGTTADWTFCSAEKPCGMGQGDCDGNNHCKPGLYCGTDNCADYNKDAHHLADCCVDPENCGMVIYGNSYGSLNTDNDALGPLVFLALNVVTNEKELRYEVKENLASAGPTYANYWLAENEKKGTDAQLHMSFACTQTITGFQLKNTHNFSWNDRGTENFSIWILKSEKWTKVQTGTLPDARNVSPVPLITFKLPSPVTTEKVIFQIDSYYGYGGGLQYFSIY